MPRFIAFLRAINVGGRTVKMGDLRNVFESAGFTNVETFIASGNVIFETPSNDSAALERKIEDLLRSSLGINVDTFIRTPTELAAVISHAPFSSADTEVGETSLYVAFMPDRTNPRTRSAVESLCSAADDIRVSEREIYWLRRVKLSERGYPAPPLEKALGMPVTVRNITTIRKLAAKYAEPGDLE